MTTQRTAQLRVCAACEWIYIVGKNPGIFGHNWDCPKCGFASYGARSVYGNKAYKYEHTQKPWMGNKIRTYTLNLIKEIKGG